MEVRKYKLFVSFSQNISRFNTVIFHLIGSILLSKRLKNVIFDHLYFMKSFKCKKYYKPYCIIYKLSVTTDKLKLSSLVCMFFQINNDDEYM